MGKFVLDTWHIFEQMAPYLLFGFLAAGVLSVVIPTDWVKRHLGGSGFLPVLKASFFGIPLPLCSCSVLPVTIGMYRQGASKASCVSFLLSTPQTGIDSVAVTYALLGPVFAVFRPLAALLTGVFGGLFVKCCGLSEQVRPEEDIVESKGLNVCCTRNHLPDFLRRIFKFGFVSLPKDIVPALLLGILIAGGMSAFLPPDYLVAYIGGGIVSIFLLMAAGVPVYVCATASVPIAAGFIHMGASPGAALAFLISGPATNVAAFSAVFKVFGKRVMFVYLTTIVFSAVGFGLLLDWLMPVFGDFSPMSSVQTVHEESRWFSHFWAVLLSAVFVLSYMIKVKHNDIHEKPPENQNDDCSCDCHSEKP